jgi:hypothetical protein
MKYIIRIDRTTIKKNPNAGNMTYQRSLGPPTITETFVNGILVSKTVQQNIETLHSLTPEPAYWYEYQNTSIICDNCYCDFLHTKLIDTWDDGEYDHFYNICPKCSKAECCEIEYEKFDESMVVQN